jgi:hypothetical protein
MIQDIIFAVGNVIFSLSLIPSLLSKNKPSCLTSSSTSLVLFVFCATFISLDMDFSAFMSYINGSFWAILFGQQFNKERKERKELKNLITY